MKALKLCTAILIPVSLIVTAFTRECITTKPDYKFRENQLLNSRIMESAGTYSASFTLKPGESVFLNSKITLLEFINVYSISNCSIDRNEWKITASNIEGIYSLPCASNNYKLFDLLIENRCRQTKTINVNLAYSSKCPFTFE